MKKERMEISDSIEWTHRDKNGKVKGHYNSDYEDTLIVEMMKKIGRRLGLVKRNCLTKYGFKECAGLILSDCCADYVPFDFVAIGTGTTAATKDDSDLESEVARKDAEGSLVTTTETDDTAQLHTIFSSDDGLSGEDDITEVGAFNDPVTGRMLMRQVFTAEPLDWDDGDTFDITVKIQLKQCT